MEGLHYDDNDISAPVVCDITVCIVLTLAVLAGWFLWLLDVQGAFLNGRFRNREVLYM